MADPTARQACEQEGRTRESPEEHELNRLGSAPTTAVAAPPSTAADSTSTPPRSRRRRLDFGIWKRLGLSRSPHIRQVPMKAARDHLANERVFLAYVRTGCALANFAVAILQLYRLNEKPAPNGALSDYDLGIPFATLTLFLAIAVTLAGTWRFFVCQDAMAKKTTIVTSATAVSVFIPLTVLVGCCLLLWLSRCLVLNGNLAASDTLHIHHHRESHHLIGFH